MAAENFYGDIVSQLGGAHVAVVSLLKDPSVDPHEYETNTADAKAVAGAALVVKNGLGYDSFVDKLLAASPRSSRLVIDGGKTAGRTDGDNPHIWYDISSLTKVAQAISAALIQLDSPNKAEYASRQQAFLSALDGVNTRVTQMKAKGAGTKILATEPVFDYMADALGLQEVDKEGAFQRAVEAGNDPPAAAVVQFRQQITSQAIKVVIYNNQTQTPITTEMQSLARANNVAVVGISETEPDGKNYQQWMLDQLTTLESALTS